MEGQSCDCEGQANIAGLRVGPYVWLSAVWAGSSTSCSVARVFLSGANTSLQSREMSPWLNSGLRKALQNEVDDSKGRPSPKLKPHAGIDLLNWNLKVNFFHVSNAQDLQVDSNVGAPNCTLSRTNAVRLVDDLLSQRKRNTRKDRPQKESSSFSEFRQDKWGGRVRKSVPKCVRKRKMTLKSHHTHSTRWECQPNSTPNKILRSDKPTLANPSERFNHGPTSHL